MYNDEGLNVSRIVIGHNTMENGIHQFQNKEKNKLLFVDTGYHSGRWGIAWIHAQTDSLQCTDCTMVVNTGRELKTDTDKTDIEDYLIIRSAVLNQGLEF